MGEETNRIVRRLFIFLAGIYFVQGISQGGPSGLFGLPIQFMLRDQLGFDQQQLSYFRGLVLIPWAVKPLYGLLSDFLPIFGYRRRSWYVIASSIGIFCSLFLFFFCDFSQQQLLIFMLGQAASFAMCDVLCDAVMVEQGKPLGLLDKAQGVQWTSISVAAILAGLGGGLIATYVSYNYMFLLMALPSFAVLVLGTVFVPEKRYQHLEFKKTETAAVIRPKEALLAAGSAAIIVFLILVINFGYWQADILELLLLIAPFLILSLLCFLFRRMLNKRTYLCILFLFWCEFALWLNVSPFFYYQTYTLGFSKVFMGQLQTIGSVGGVVGALLFLAISRKKLFWKKRFLTETSLGNLLKWSGFIGVILILSNFFLMGFKSAIVLTVGTLFIYQFARLSLLVLAGEFCPIQISGTFFALLMSVSNLGSSMSERASGKLFNVFSAIAPHDLADNFWARFMVWLGWPSQHMDPNAPYDIFVQYYTIGWLIIVSLCAFSLYFLAIRYFGDSVKEKEELKALDLSRSLRFLSSRT